MTVLPAIMSTALDSLDVVDSMVFLAHLLAALEKFVCPLFECSVFSRVFFLFVTSPVFVS